MKRTTARKSAGCRDAQHRFHFRHFILTSSGTASTLARNNGAAKLRRRVRVLQTIMCLLLVSLNESQLETTLRAVTGRRMPRPQCPTNG